MLLFGLVWLAIIIFAPLGGIWSLNTLFELEIPFTLATWGAGLVLFLFLQLKLNLSFTKTETTTRRF